MTILHIDSSARLEDSNSRIVSQYLVEQLSLRGGESEVIVRDLVLEPLPPMTAADIVGVHGSHSAEGNPALSRHLATSEELVDELKRADTLVFGLAMYNFSVPAYLKQWIDYVCRAGVTFRYGANGPEGLTAVKRAYIVTASGGTTVGGNGDFASTYLEHICRFLGIEEIHHIDASGSKREPEKVISQAKSEVDRLLLAAA